MTSICDIEKEYSGGDLMIYRDETPVTISPIRPHSLTASWSSPGGTIPSHYYRRQSAITPHIQSSRLEATLYFTGGSEFPRVSTAEGYGFVATDDGPITWAETGDPLPQEIEALGYGYRFSTGLDLTGEVPVKPTTWSRVKSLYR